MAGTGYDTLYPFSGLVELDGPNESAIQPE